MYGFKSRRWLHMCRGWSVVLPSLDGSRRLSPSFSRPGSPFGTCTVPVPTLTSTGEHAMRMMNCDRPNHVSTGGPGWETTVISISKHLVMFLHVPFGPRTQLLFPPHGDMWFFGGRPFSRATMSDPDSRAVRGTLRNWPTQPISGVGVPDIADNRLDQTRLPLPAHDCPLDSSSRSQGPGSQTAAAAINPPLNLLIPSPSPQVYSPVTVTHKCRRSHSSAPFSLDAATCPRVPLNPLSTRASPSQAFNCLKTISHPNTCLGHRRSNTCPFIILFITTIIVIVFSP